MPDPAFERWLQALEARHLADLSFPEVSRALRALSSTYVERRDRLAEGAALEGAGKRAAFALFYGPLHYMLVRSVMTALGVSRPGGPIADLGCGTGAAGAAWAIALERRVEVVGVDRHPWAVAEASWTYRTLALNGRAKRGDAADGVPRTAADIIAAFTVNELRDASRASLLAALTGAASRGSRVLIVEPLAKAGRGWWPEWRAAFAAIGGREDEWRFPSALPPLVQKLDRAAGLDHRELTGRTLWVDHR
jgi:SAM-dependent methyltransferase